MNKNEYTLMANIPRKVLNALKSLSKSEMLVHITYDSAQVCVWNDIFKYSITLNDMARRNHSVKKYTQREYSRENTILMKTD